MSESAKKFYDLNSYYQFIFDTYDKEKSRDQNDDTKNANCLAQMSSKVQVYQKYTALELRYFSKKGQHQILELVPLCKGGFGSIFVITMRDGKKVILKVIQKKSKTFFADLIKGQESVLRKVRYTTQSSNQLIEIKKNISYSYEGVGIGDTFILLEYIDGMMLHDFH